MSEGINTEGVNVSENIETKISRVYELIDPKKTLPKIDLQISLDNVNTLGSLAHTKYDLKHGDKVIGEMAINTNKKDHMSWIYPINIEEDYKGKGFGLVAHVAAIEKSFREGNSFRTHDWSHTEGSKHIWETLAKKGVAKIVEPFQSDENGKYSGWYEVRPELIK